MSTQKKIEWVLRVGVAGEFLGHGVLALQHKAAWIDWFGIFGVTDAGTAATLLTLIGLLDLVVAISALLRPFRPLLMWAVFWGFFTALLRPIVGEPIWDFIERSANWAAPLALFWLLPQKR